MSLRLVLAGDAALIRQAIAELLQQAGVEAVAQTDNSSSLVRAVENNRPDVAIIDIRMPPTQTREGIHAALEIRELFPSRRNLAFVNPHPDRRRGRTVPRNRHPRRLPPQRLNV
jgi:DNA-binding NarL/FixJ family response regulator